VEENIFLCFSDYIRKRASDYDHFSTDLSDVLYSDTSNGEYTLGIVMPSGLIKVDEMFYLCIEDPVTGSGHGRVCYNLINSTQQWSKEITIRI
jgi:hypothetical protein